MLLKRSTLALMLHILQLLTSLGTVTVVTRATGPSGNGIYALLWVVTSLATLLTGLGLNHAAVYYIGQKKYPLREVVATLLTVSLIQSVAAVALVGLSYTLFQNSYFRDVEPQQIGAALFWIPFVQLSASLGAAVLGMNKPVHAMGITSVRLVVTLLVQFLFLFCGQLTLTRALVGAGIGTVVSTWLGIHLVSQATSIKLGMNRSLLKDLSAYGLKAYFANLNTFFSYRLDSLIVNGLLGVTSLGYYSLATSLAEPLWTISGAISTVMFPHVSSTQRQEADRLTAIVCRNTLFITAIAALIALAVSPWLITLVFTATMLPALYPFWLLLPGILSLSGGKVIASYLSGIGKPIYATYISFFNLILTIILDFLLIPIYGIHGAAIASSIVYTSMTVVGVWAFLHESGNSLPNTILLQRSDLAYYRQVFEAVKSFVS